MPRPLLVRRRINLTPLRPYVSAASASCSANASIEAAVPGRWLADLKQRVGRCMSFGLTKTQVDEAGDILKVVAKDWRELVAGSDGFLTGKGRAGFESREVEWGEMVSIVNGQKFRYS